MVTVSCTEDKMEHKWALMVWSIVLISDIIENKQSLLISQLEVLVISVQCLDGAGYNLTFDK